MILYVFMPDNELVVKYLEIHNGMVIAQGKYQCTSFMTWEYNIF